MAKFKQGDVVRIDGIDGELVVTRSHCKTVTTETEAGEIIRAPEHRVTRARRVRKPYKRKERPQTASDVARRYSVSPSTVLEWARAHFLPPPDEHQGEPVWWPGVLDAHDQIVWTGRGTPSHEKARALERLVMRNRPGAWPYKKR